MSIFSKIKNAIWGHKPAAPAPAPAPTAAPKPAPTPQATAPARPAAPAQPAPAAPAQAVDVEQVLQSMATARGVKLNWQTSIVDLMKLVGMESSLAERKELAQELGYTGELNGSAEMNIWLHKRVMKELAANGGKVPASMLD